MAKLRVLMITVRADYGGGPEHVYRLISNLSDSIAVYVAAPDDFPYYGKYSALAGEENMIKIPHREFIVKDLFRLEKFVKKNNIDLIHSHGKGAGLYSRLLHLLTRKPVVHTFHGLHIDKYNSFQAKLYIWLERFLSSMTQGFISVSRGEFEKAVNLRIALSRKISLIENGVALPDKIKEVSAGDSLPLKILTVTRFDYAKNTGLLIPVLEKLIEMNMQEYFRFVIVGAGEDEENFRKEIERKGYSPYFVFAGTTEKISEFYRSSFCYISTSRWEGLPLSVMEAMSYGLPVVATNVTGNNDLIKNRVTGIIYPLEEPAKAAEGIVELYKNKELRNGIIDSAKNNIQSKYSLSRMAQQTEKLYFKVIKRRYIE